MTTKPSLTAAKKKAEYLHRFSDAAAKIRESKILGRKNVQSALPESQECAGQAPLPEILISEPRL